MLCLRSTGRSDGGGGCVLPVQSEMRIMMACRACALWQGPSNSALLRAGLHVRCLNFTKRFNGRDSAPPEQMYKRTSMGGVAGGLCLCAEPCAVKLTCRAHLLTLEAWHW